MSEMILRVARAAHDAQWEEPFPAEGSIAYAVAIQVARAAIEAMRVPTEGMYLAAWNAEVSCSYTESAHAWAAMIDEALK